MRADLESLYDAHAHRLYAHCWSLLGDHGAADALRDTLTQAIRQPPQGETVLWLHHVTRTVCSERGAFDQHDRHVFAQTSADPLLNAAGNLPADHREALLLSAGEWLDVRDISRLLRVSPGSVRKLLHEARTALEHLVLDVLMRRTADSAEHMDVIEAFEERRLPHLLARRAPALAPAPLRDLVLAAAGERDEIGQAPADPTRQLVVIGQDAGTAGNDVIDIADAERERARRRKAVVKGAGGVAGVAASVTVGLLMTWPSGGNGTVGALGPSDGETRPGPSPAGTTTNEQPVFPEYREGGRQAAPDPAPPTEEQAPAGRPANEGVSSTRLKPPPAEKTPSAPPSTPPTDTRQTTPPPSQEPPDEEPPDEEPPPDDGSRPNGPLDPVVDVIGSVTSPIFGG